MTDTAATGTERTKVWEAGTNEVRQKVTAEVRNESEK